MTPVPSTLDQPASDFEQPVEVGRKSRSVKQFLLQSGATLVIGLGVIGIAGLVAWLARDQLATTSLSAFLRSKGIPATVAIENLQFDTAQIRDLRLGPADRPSLVAKNTLIKWRIDSKARLFIVERLQIEGVTLSIGINSNGKVDFGALAPLMKPGSGPKRSIINNVSLSNATLLMATPQGPAIARLTAWGGEAAGWTGRADVTPPASLIATSNQPFAPIRLGFAVKRLEATTRDNKATTFIGFSARPNGQSLTYQGTDVLGVTGNVTGQLALQDGGNLWLDTRPIALRIDKASANGAELTGLDLTTNSLFWTQLGNWQTAGWGNIVATGTYNGFKLPAAKVQTGSTRFRIGAARAQSGRMQLDYQGDVQNLSGAITGRRLVVDGNVSTTLHNITKFDTADIVGKGRVSASSIVMPTKMRADLLAAIPPALSGVLAGTFSGAGAFDYRITPTSSQINLAGPLSLTSSNGARASWSPDGGMSPNVVIKSDSNGTLNISGLAAGKIALDVRGFGALNGEIDGASFGPNGWALIGRGLSMRSSAFLANTDTNIRFDRLEVSAPRSGALSGSGSGLAIISAANASRAQLGFDLRATPTALTGTIQGPIEGFGDVAGLGGYGARSGSVLVNGTASRQAQGWQMDARGQIRADAIATSAVSVTSPTLALTSVGQVTDQGGISARVTVSGRANSAQPKSARPQLGFDGVRLDGSATLGGSLSALQLTGNLTSGLDNARFSDFRVGAATTLAQFSGSIGREQARLTGSHTTQFGRLSRASGPESGRIDIVGVRASGPFAFSSGQQGQNPPFWDGRLGIARTSLTTDLALNADSVRAGTTSLTKLRLTAPLTMASNGTAWRANAKVNLTSDRLKAGDSQLLGLVASGPLAASNERNNHIRISSSQCLDFAARSGTFPGEASVGAVSGKLCPDTKGQLAVLTNAAPRLFATTLLNPLTIQMGGPAGDQSIEIGDVNGTLTTNPNGSLGLNMLATQFGLNLKLPDGTTATIKANEAALDIAPMSGGIGLKGRLGRVSSIGLPVLLSGSATTDLMAGTNGLVGVFNFDDIIVKDIEKAPRFGEFRLVGEGTLVGDQVSILSDVLEPASDIKVANVILSHDIGTGAGNLDLTAADLLMAPAPVRGRPGLDIVTLIPPLRGVVSDMVGVANASANLAWARNMPIVSRAKIETKGLDFGTMLGPVTGFSGDVRLDDILSVSTPGLQTIKVGLFDPGLPIEDGTVQFILPGNNTLRLEDASWPFAEGKLSVRPATWAFRDGDQAFAIDVEDVDLAKLLRLTEVPNLEIDGKVSGVFPIEVREGNVEIVGGRLKAREGGGVIRYTGPNPSPPPPPPGFVERMRRRLFGKPPPAGADLAIEALRALEYKILEITVDGRITGELIMGVILEGANQQVLSGQPFKFNIKMNVPVGQLLDNLNRLNNAGSSPEVLKEIDRVMREEAANPSEPVAPPASPPASPPAPQPIPAP